MSPNTTPDAPTPKKPRRAYKPELDPKNPPPRVDRQAGAALLLAALGIRVSPRTLEGWPVPSALVNGRATYGTSELLAHGRAMLDGTPCVRGGRTCKAA